jgi:DNA-binding XRE family transcriptional regulator
MNVNKLKGKIVEQGITTAQLAKQIGVNRATLYRKLANPDTISLKDIAAIIRILNLNANETTAIFFNDPVA